MIDLPDTGPIRRILVALDASPPSLAALHAAVELAADLDAELRALFVEDVDLIRMASLPFTREVSRVSVSTQRFSHVGAERQLRLQARRVRQSLETATSAANVPYTLETVRGRVTSAILTASAAADLLVLGQTARAYSCRRTLGRTARQILSEADVSVTAFHQYVAFGGHVLVLYDDSGDAAAALRLAVQLSEREESFALTVLLPEGDSSPPRDLRRSLSQRLASHVPVLRFTAISRSTLLRLTDVVRNARGGVLILPKETPLIPGRRLHQLMCDAECPVILAR